MNALAAAIEEWLLERADWVAAAEIETAFGVKERELRATDGAPGLCTAFAISGNRGYRHVENATNEEFAHFYARERGGGIGRLVRARRLKRRRENVLVPKPSPPPETVAGQYLLGVAR